MVPVADLLTSVKNDLGGYANSVSQDQLLEKLNRGKDEVCSIIKTLRDDYFVTSSQSTSSNAAHYFGPMATNTREYTLPSDCTEIRAIEVSNVGYEETIFSYRDISHPEFQATRKAATAAGVSSGINNSTYLYTIVGKSTFMLADYPEAAFTPTLWYIFTVPDFAADDSLTEILFPFTKHISDWAVKRLMLAKQDPQQYTLWQQEWRNSVITLLGEVGDRSTTNATFVQDYLEG